MKTNFLMIVLLVHIATGPLSASELAPSLMDILHHVGQDQKSIVTSPLRADRRDLWIWGAAGASLLALMPEYNARQSNDERLLVGIERENPMYGSFFKKLTYIGDGGVLFGTSLATYGISSLSDYEPGQRFSAHWIEALADTTLWVTVIKVLAGRNRPQAKGEPESEFSSVTGYFRNQGVNSSFPSGHTALAFATAAVVTRESDNNLWVGVPAYVVAGGVGFSRLYVEKHWLSDILVGAALGYSIGTLVENRRHRPEKIAFRIEPVLNPEQPGLQLVYQW